MLILKNMRSHPGNESNATSIEIIKIECDDANNRHPRSLSTADVPTSLKSSTSDIHHKEMEKKCPVDDLIKTVVKTSELPAGLSASEPLSNTKNVPNDALSFSSPVNDCNDKNFVEQRVAVRKKPTFEIAHIDDLMGRKDRLCRGFTSETRAIKYLMDVIIAATNEDTPCSMYHCRGNLCVRFAKQHFILTIREIT